MAMHRTDLPSSLILMALGLKEETSNEGPPPLSEVIIGSTSSDVVPEAATITAPFRPTLSTWLNVDGTVEAAADRVKDMVVYDSPFQCTTLISFVLSVQ